MRIRSLRGLLLPAIALLVIGVPVATRVVTAVDRPGGAKGRNPGSPIGTVTFLKGNAVALGVDNRERELRLRSQIFVDDKLVCGEDGKVDVTLDDGSVVSLGAISEMVIDEYVYDPGGRNKSGCALRFANGFFRIVTGAITALNPDRFKVRSRLATIGIRGCETGFRSADGRDDVYIMELGANESVVIETTANGAPMTDVVTGRELPVAPDNRRVVNVDRAGFHASIIVGKGPSISSTSTSDLKELREQTSHLPLARYDLLQKPGGSVLILRPDGAGTGASQDE